MPRRGERSRDFRHDDPALGPARIGVRQVVTLEANGKKSVLRFDPSRFACQLLAQELADEWAEYVEVAARRTGTAIFHRQSITLFCEFVDAHLPGRAPTASLGGADPDLAEVLLAWEYSL